MIIILLQQMEVSLTLATNYVLMMKELLRHCLPMLLIPPFIGYRNTSKMAVKFTSISSGLPDKDYIFIGVCLLAC